MANAGNQFESANTSPVGCVVTPMRMPGFGTMNVHSTSRSIVPPAAFTGSNAQTELRLLNDGEGDYRTAINSA